MSNVMERRIAWFSAGAASAIAAKLSRPDVIAYCETGAEDADNERFLKDVEGWIGSTIKRLRSDKYADTWDVWEKRRYLAGISGAPCTGELKIKPRLAFERPGDIHVFGYTYDKSDMKRAEAFRENWPDLKVETPLIDRRVTKAACLDLLRRAGVAPPRVYAMGFQNANCIPCVKATSPAYWALIRQHFPEQFERFARLSRELGVKAARVKGQRVFVDEIPMDQSTTDPIAPECDFLCALAELEFGAAA